MWEFLRLCLTAKNKPRIHILYTKSPQVKRQVARQNCKALAVLAASLVMQLLGLCPINLGSASIWRLESGAQHPIMSIFRQPAAMAQEAKEGPSARSRLSRGIETYFASCRLNEGSRIEPRFGTARHLDIGSGTIEYGTAALYAPQNLPLPSECKSGIEYRDALRLATEMWRQSKLNFLACFAEEALFEKLRKCKGKICIYIHGYDKTFEQSLEDACMLFADHKQYLSANSQFLPILFNWPSASSPSKYAEDEANLEWSRKSFFQFMDRVLAEKQEDCSLEIVAHSMGCRLIFDYICRGGDSESGPSEGGGSGNKTKKPFLNNLYLCSADLDFHAAEEQKEKLESSVSGMTYIFVSDRDRPLIMSQYLHGQPRLGRPMDPPRQGGNPQTSSRTAAAAEAKGSEDFMDKISSSGFWKGLTLDALEVWLGPNKTDLPEVMGWLSQNPSLDQDFARNASFVDVSNLAQLNMGHAICWSVVSSLMAGETNLSQLRKRVVHKIPDQSYLTQCGGKPRVLYRFHRLDPL